MRNKKVFLATLTILVLLFCSSCKDRIELEEQGYVSAIGIDKGKGNNLSITYQITNVRYGNVGKGTASSDEIKDETVTFESPDLVTAMNLINISVARRISLSHARILVVGEDYARNPEFFLQLEAALREKEFKRSMNILVSIEKASEFLRGNDPQLEARTSKYFDFMYDRWKETGTVPESDLNTFMIRSEGNSSLFLAIYVSTKKDTPNYLGGEANYLPGQVAIEGGNPTQMVGAAVFKAGKMIGKLTGDENRTNVLLRPTIDVGSMLYTFEDPMDVKYKISTRVTQIKKNKYEIDVSTGAPKLDVTVPLQINILAIPSFTKYVEDPVLQEQLRISIEKQLKENASILVKKTQKLFKGEPFLWGAAVIRKSFWTYDEYKNYNWMEKYQNATVTVHFNVKIKGFGKQLNPAKKPDENDKN